MKSGAANHEITEGKSASCSGAEATCRCGGLPRASPRDLAAADPCRIHRVLEHMAARTRLAVLLIASVGAAPAHTPFRGVRQAC